MCLQSNHRWCGCCVISHATHMLSICPASTTDMCHTCHAMCCHVCVILHVKDPQLNVVRVRQWRGVNFHLSLQTTKIIIRQTGGLVWSKFIVPSYWHTEKPRSIMLYNISPPLLFLAQNSTLTNSQFCDKKCDFSLMPLVSVHFNTSRHTDSLLSLGKYYIVSYQHQC